MYCFFHINFSNIFFNSERCEKSKEPPLKVGIVCYKMKELTFSKQTLVFTCLQCKSLENTVEKGEIAHYEQFLVFP